MSQRSIAADYANPAIMSWARASVGYSIEAAAKKLSTKPEKLLAWETGESPPTVRQLEKMANVYKRPLAAFFLRDVPKLPEPIRDFRCLDGALSRKLSPNLHIEVRRIRNRRKTAIELAEMLNEPAKTFDLRAELSEDPEVVAARIRSGLGVSVEEQLSWDRSTKEPREALQKWRDAVEGLGLLVMQISGVEVTEMRGLSLSEPPFPVIALNGKDSASARIFTLQHELAHLTLRIGGLCDLALDHWVSVGRVPRIEVFCNHVAGAVLVPREALISHGVVRGTDHPRDSWTSEEIGALAKDFKVSREVVLRRLVIARRASMDLYKRKRRELLASRQQDNNKDGFLPPHRRALRDNGHRYTSLVLDALGSGSISRTETSRLLGLKLRHFPRIEEELNR